MASVTINDVARAAGVSKRTVTRVLNNESDVRDRTRKKVQEVIAQLGYVPNSLAQRLAAGHSEIIGVYAYGESFPFERTQFFYPFVEGVEAAAQRLSYDVLLFTSGRRSEDHSMFDGNSSRTSLADGLVVIGARVNRGDLRRLAELKRPFVCVGRRESKEHAISWVAADYESAFYEATQDIIAHGHKRIAYISPLDFEAELDKFQGYQRALNDARLPLFYFDPMKYNPEQQLDVEALCGFLIANAITALILPYPHHFRPLQSALQKRGLSIPHDISFVGFDDDGLLLDDYPISHVAMPKVGMGERAVDELVRIIRGKNQEPEVHCWLPCQYNRGTTVRCLK